ncbi:hypothetical protein ABYF34_00280 [Buchananella felis]
MATCRAGSSTSGKSAVAASGIASVIHHTPMRIAAAATVRSPVSVMSV